MLYLSKFPFYNLNYVKFGLPLRMKSDLVQTGTYVLSAIALAGTKYSNQVLKKAS
jgi:hypothetical protein